MSALLASSERHRRSRLLDTILWEQQNKSHERSVDPFKPSSAHHGGGGRPWGAGSGGATPGRSGTARDVLSPASASSGDGEEADTSVFPQWLTNRQDFQRISEEPLAETVIRRESAEEYLRSSKHVDPKRHGRYFQGPLRTLSLRRHGVLYGTFQDRHTITMESIGAYSSADGGNSNALNRHSSGVSFAPGSEPSGGLKHASSTLSVSNHGGTLRRVGGEGKGKGQPVDEDEAAREEEERVKILAVLEVRGPTVSAYVSMVTAMSCAELQACLLRFVTVRAVLW
jgi:hypothetical protein